RRWPPPPSGRASSRRADRSTRGAAAAAGPRTRRARAAPLRRPDGAVTAGGPGGGLSCTGRWWPELALRPARAATAPSPTPALPEATVPSPTPARPQATPGSGPLGELLDQLGAAGDDQQVVRGHHRLGHRIGEILARGLHAHHR